MKQFELSKWLKGLVIATGLIGLIICLFLVPWLGRDAVILNPKLDYMFYPCLIFIWITAIPFFIALVKCWGISCEISKDNSFCEKNAKTLQFISKLALSEALLYIIALVLLVFLNVLHSGIFLMILFIIFVAIAIAVVAAAVSHLVKKASDLKQENEFTI